MSKRSRIRLMLLSLLRFAVATFTFSILLYVLFALFFSTEEERQLQRENQLYKARYRQMKAKADLIADAVEGLRDKDEVIYGELFKASAPSADPVVASSAQSSAEELMRRSQAVDRDFREAFRLMESHRDSIPPLSLPLRGMSYVQTGASVGLKYNPVYKLALQHDGLDLVAPQGTPVYAVADGMVSKVVHSRKGLGNQVEIDHGNGYVTRYCLLGDMQAVRGRRVKRGQQIGRIGISTSFPAPHLHFEVRRGGRVCDPVHYFFASLTPEEYTRMLYLSASTSQSMD